MALPSLCQPPRALQSLVNGSAWPCRSCQLGTIFTAPGAPHFAADQMRRSLQTITHYVAQQKLIPREFSVDELFDDATRGLLP